MNRNKCTPHGQDHPKPTAVDVGAVAEVEQKTVAIRGQGGTCRLAQDGRRLMVDVSDEAEYGHTGQRGGGDFQLLPGNTLRFALQPCIFCLGSPTVKQRREGYGSTSGLIGRSELPLRHPPDVAGSIGPGRPPLRLWAIRGVANVTKLASAAARREGAVPTFAESLTLRRRTLRSCGTLPRGVESLLHLRAHGVVGSPQQTHLRDEGSRLQGER